MDIDTPFPPEPAKRVKLWAHWHGGTPEPSTWLRPVGPRSRACYRIMSVRAARKPGKFHLVCEKHPLADLERLAGDEPIYNWHWAPRAKRKARPAGPLL